VAQPNATSRTTAWTGGVSIPRLFIDNHLRDLQPAAVSVYLVLCGQQARVGRNEYFRYTIPEIAQAAGVKNRVFSTALDALKERQLIERQRFSGPAGNRYRINWGRPAATNRGPNEATIDEAVSVETHVPQLNPPEPEVATVVAAETTLPADLGPQVPNNFESPESLATTPGELEEQRAGRQESEEQEAQATPDKTEPAARTAEAPSPTVPKPGLPSPEQGISISTQPPQPLEPTAPATRATGGAHNVMASAPSPEQAPPAANALQPSPPSFIPPSSSATLATEIHRLTSSIVGRPADRTMIQGLETAADNDLELLRTVLEDIDKRRAGRPGTRDNELERWRAALVGNKKPPYDAAFRAMFCEEVYRRCQDLRSELTRKANQPANAGQPVTRFRKLSRRERRRMKAAANNLKRSIADTPTPQTLAPR